MKKNNFLKIVIGFVIFSGMVHMTHAVSPFVIPASGTPEPLKFLDVSSANQGKQGWLGLGSVASYNPLGTLDVRYTTIADKLSIIGKAWFSGNLFIGATSLPPIGSIKLVVDRDHIRSSVLAGSGNRPTCSDASGKFVTCTGSGIPPIVSTSPLCGSTANTYATSLPTENLCNTGAHLGIAVSGGADGTYNWTCYSTSGSFTSATCSTSPLVPTCGEATYAAVTSSPSSGLCYSGTASAVGVASGGSGMYTWTCSDTYGNPPVTCTTPNNAPTPTTPTNCFAIRSTTVGRAVLTCANGSASATSYQLQIINPLSMRWSNLAGADTLSETVSSTSALAKNNALGSWAHSMAIAQPNAVFFSSLPGGFVDSNDTGGAYVWHVKACNAGGVCSPYSEPIFPGNLTTGADSAYGPSPVSFRKTAVGSTVTFAWDYPIDATGFQLYPTVFIHQCTYPGCINTSTRNIESVDPATVSSTSVPHTGLSCSGGSCTTSITGSLSTDYMITVGKDLYNDTRVGPTIIPGSASLSGYVDPWDQYSPWAIAY